MAKTFYLIRHGLKENLAGDPPLSTIGRKQAEVTAKYLTSLKIRKIYSSPLRRTFQTANIIAKEFGLKIIKDERLTERMNWYGIDSLENFLKEWRKTDMNRNYRPSYGFSSKESGERMKEALDLAASNGEDRAVFVTHGGSTEDLLLTLFSENELEIHNRDFMMLRSNGLIKECSITILKVEKGVYQLEQLASTKHLTSFLG